MSEGEVEGQELTATLIVGVARSTCSHCQLGAFPNQETHEDQAGYGGQGKRGCGARFVAMTPEQCGLPNPDEWREAMAALRPDLPILWEG